MNSDQEQRMRSMLAEYGPEELIDTAVGLQQIIDSLNEEKGGWSSVVANLKKQNEALQVSSGGDPEEERRLRTQIANLEARNKDLQELNEGLQKKLIG